jgi:hypothetical protein
MTKFTEGRHPGEFLLSEAHFHRSRETVNIPESQNFQPGTVLGKRAVVAGVVSTPLAAVGNTGNATIAMGAPPVTSKVVDGRYKGIAVTATTVRWEDPNGKEIGVSTHGAAFAKGGVKFTITAGGTPNVANDEFYVDVEADATDFEWLPLNLAATDGTEVAAGVPFYGTVTAVGETAQIAAVVRSAEVKGPMIIWPGSITASQKADAIQALALTGIIIR